MRSFVSRHGSCFVDFLHVYKYSLMRQYVFVPIGVIVMWLILYGVNKLIKDVIGVVFPASVAVMLFNFGSLCVFSWINEEYAQKYIGIIDIPLSWALRWMNLFFTPAFVTLPLSPWISFREAMLIATAFVCFYLITGFCLAYTTIFCQKALGLFTKYQPLSSNKEADEEEKPVELSALDSTTLGYSSGEEEEESDAYDSDDDMHSFADIFSEHHHDEDFQLRNVATNSGFPLGRHQSRHHSRTVISVADDSSALEAGFLDHTSTTKKTQASQELEEYLDDEDDLMTYPLHDQGQDQFQGHTNPASMPQEPLPALSMPRSSWGSRGIGSAHHRHPDHTGPHEANCERAITRQMSRSIEHKFMINMWHDHLHHILYGIGFFATIFTYYFSWYLMPFQLFTAVCMFFIITDAPLVPNPKYKKYLHPTLCSVALFWLVELISSLIKHRHIKYFLSDLRKYKVGTTYLNLFTNTHTSGDHKNWPGAGDVITSCMDVSIVALSMPMYTYRRDLKRHFAALMPPILALCAVTLMLNPYICYKIGISPYNSIGFIGRSITLALGIPTIENFDGSVTVMAVITVVSGIAGAIFGGPMLDFFRVPKDDFITRGLTLGCNCGAIATSYLLTVDRRAAAISSLSFVVYGALMVILSSIGPIQDFIHNLVSL